MRYWALLAIKLLISALVPLLLWLPVEHHILANQPVTAWPLRTLAKLSTFPFVVLFSVLLQWTLRDQRFRCRVCARRLRMPISDGTYGAVLLDRPGTEYICPFGHGKLYVPEADPTGNILTRWTRYGDLWQEISKQ